MERIDAHCHLWEVGRGDYDWLNAPSLAAIKRDYRLADLQSTVATFRVEQSILVQAAPTESETRYLLSLAQSATEIGGVVGWVDMNCEGVANNLAKLAASPLLKGIRPMLQDIADTDWILGASQKVALGALADLGLRFEALVQPRHLKALVTTCSNYSELPIVINHVAKPALGAKAGDPRHEIWTNGMTELGRNTSAFCKWSGLLTEMRPEQRNTPNEVLAVLRPVFDQLLEWFGPNRIMWGSDWPVVTLADNYGAWVEISNTLLDALSQRDRDAILSGNAKEFYGLASNLT